MLIEKINGFDHVNASPVDLKALSDALKLVAQYTVSKSKNESAKASTDSARDKLAAMDDYASEMFEKTLSMVRTRMLMASPIGAYEEIDVNSLWLEFCYAHQVGPFEDVKFANNRRGKDWRSVVSKIVWSESAQVAEKLRPVMDAYAADRLAKKYDNSFVQLLYKRINSLAKSEDISQSAKKQPTRHRSVEAFFDDGVVWQYMIANADEAEFQEDILSALDREHPRFDRLSLEICQKFLVLIRAEYQDTIVHDLIEKLDDDFTALIVDQDIDGTLRNLHRQIRNGTCVD